MVLITQDAQEQIEALPKKINERVARIVERLEEWPEVSGTKPLRGELAGRWRIRTGDYRVQFFVDPAGNTVIEKVGKRDRFYED